MNNVLRANKAAEYLGIGESTLWRWTREGKISCVKLSEKVTVWQKSELDRFIASKSSNAA